MSLKISKQAQTPSRPDDSHPPSEFQLFKRPRIRSTSCPLALSHDGLSNASPAYLLECSSPGVMPAPARPVGGVDYPRTYQEFKARIPKDAGCREYLAASVAGWIHLSGMRLRRLAYRQGPVD